MTSSNDFRGPSLRNPVSERDSRGTGEGLRDLERVIRQIPNLVKVELPNKVYTPPFYVAFDHVPFGVILARAKNAKSPTYTSTTFVGWAWDKSAIRIDTLTGLTVGEAYDLNFLVVG